MLVESNEDYLILVVNDEIFRISIFHVKNFSVNPIKTEDQESEQTPEETTNEITSEEQTTTVVERLSAGQLATSNQSNAKRRRMNRIKKKAKEQSIKTK